MRALVYYIIIQIIINQYAQMTEAVTRFLERTVEIGNEVVVVGLNGRSHWENLPS